MVLDFGVGGAGGSMEGLSPWRQSTLARKFDLLSGEQMVGLGEGKRGQARLRTGGSLKVLRDETFVFLSSHGLSPETVSLHRRFE